MHPFDMPHEPRITEMSYPSIARLFGGRARRVEDPHLPDDRGAFLG